MTGSDFREIMEAILPEHVLRQVVETTGFEQRVRKRDALAFLRSMVIAAASPSGGRQADVMRSYFDSGAPRVARGSFYGWFGPPLEKAMEEIVQIASRFVEAQTPDLPGILGLVKDWRIVDSMTVRLHDSLKDIYPGTGDYAALKVHKTMSVGWGTVVDYHLSPAKEHDSPHLVLNESWRGMGLLVDLGYASMQRLKDCERFGVSVIMRLKSNWKPKVQKIVRGALSDTLVPGTDLDIVLEDEALTLGNCIDADVTVGSQKIPMRLVGVFVPEKGYFFYLTNISRRIGSHQISAIYRVRWEIESNNKLDKSSHRLHEIDARMPAAVRALVHATMVSSMIVNLIVHRYSLGIAERCEDIRTEAPLHAGLVARMLSQCSLSIAQAFELEGPNAEAEWERLAGAIVHVGKDPNWRQKPSILDQLRGWKIVPSRRKARKTRSKKAGKQSTA